MQVVGDTAYLLTDDDIGAYSLPDGDELWRRATRPKPASMAAAMANADRTDTICIGSRDGTIHWLDAETGDTTLAIDTPVEGGIHSIARGETTIVVVVDDTLYAYNVSNGEERWRQDFRPADARARAVVDGTLVGTIKSESGEESIMTVDIESGRRHWRHTVGMIKHYGVTNGRFIVGTEGGPVYGFTIN